MELVTTSEQAMWLLIPSIPICLYVIYTDLSEMRIPNTMVIALLLVFAIFGFMALPLDEYLWRYSHFAVVLFIGFLLSAFVGIGAGDAKFAAAMAPFVALGDWHVAMLLYMAFAIGGLILHKTARAIGPIQRAAAGWTSFDPDMGHFPLGISLAAMHITYLSLAAFA